jgi:GPH family glycoside/pentoside/hexuronide:cation symporter
MSENPNRYSEEGPSSAEHHETRPEDRVPLGQKLALGIGAFPNTTGTQILQVMAFPIFQIVLGCHPALIGLAMTIPRLWDAVSDPIMGYISDNFRSRYGRRRPFIVVGAFLLAASFVLVWMVPPNWSERTLGQTTETASRKDDSVAVPRAEPDREPDDSHEAGNTNQDVAGAEREFTWRDWAMFLWLLTTSLIFYTCFTVYSVPLVSLSYEMTPDYHERTRVMAYWGFFTMAGNFFINWYYPLTERTEFFWTNPLQGAGAISLVVGLWIFIGFGVLPGIYCRERIYRSAAKQQKVKLFSAIGQTIRSRPMLMLLGMNLCLNFVGAMAAAFALYIVIFYVFHGDRKAGSLFNAWNGVGFQIVGFAAIPVLSWLATRTGKRGAMFIVLGLAAAGGVAKWFIYTPALPYLFLLDPILSGPIWVALGVIVPAMMADLCDVDEYEHGKRREGVFGAVFSWIQKVGFSVTFLFSGLAIWLSGFDEQLGANQPPQAIFVIRLCFAGFSVLAMLGGMAFLCFYNVTERRAYEVRRLLEERRGKAWDWPDATTEDSQ